MSSSEMLEHALEYREANWSVFPVCSPSRTAGRCTEGHVDKCTTPGKTPLIRWASAQQRVPDEDLVRTWWRHWPAANIGLATGKTSGVCVVDIDSGEALAEAQRRGFPPGPAASTGRVGGRHLYFAWRDNAPTIFARAGGIDFRGEGGYVVLPPSRHKTGAVYHWTASPGVAPLPPLPSWIDEMATLDREGKPRGPLSVGRLFADGIPEGERDLTLFRVASKLRAVDVPEDVAVGVLVELAARCKPAFDPSDARRKVESAYRRYRPSPRDDSPDDVRERYTVVVPD